MTLLRTFLGQVGLHREKACVTIKPKDCQYCGAVSLTELTVVKSDFDAWRRGTLIQQAFPYLLLDERESLITGMCSTCWGML